MGCPAGSLPLRVQRWRISAAFDVAWNGGEHGWVTNRERTPSKSDAMIRPFAWSAVRSSGFHLG